MLWNPNVHHSFHTSPPPPLCPDPDRSSPSPHPISWRFILILFSNLLVGLPSGLVPSAFPTKTVYTAHLFPIRAICPSSLILDWLLEEYLVSCTGYEASHCTVSSSLHYFIPLRAAISSSVPYYQTPSAYILTLLWEIQSYCIRIFVLL